MTLTILYDLFLTNVVFSIGAFIYCMVMTQKEYLNYKYKPGYHSKFGNPWKCGFHWTLTAAVSIPILNVGVFFFFIVPAWYRDFRKHLEKSSQM